MNNRTISILAGVILFSALAGVVILGYEWIGLWSFVFVAILGGIIGSKRQDSLEQPGFTQNDLDLILENIGGVSEEDYTKH